MKKSLIALAVAGAFAAPAFAATSNVDVYGVLNIAIQDSSISGVGPSVVDNVSRIGFKGSEDLGGGLKGIWQIESGLSGNPNVGGNGGTTVGTGTGVGGATLAGRNTFLGVAGGFGTFLMGRHDTPYKLGTASLDIFADTVADYNGGGTNGAIFPAVGGPAMTGRLNGVELLMNAHDARSPQAIAYISPTWSGFHFAAAGIMTNDSTQGNDADNKSLDGLSLTGVYINGPLFASLSYQKVHDADAFAGTTGVDAFLDVALGAGTYSFAESAAWKLGVGYTLGDTKLGFVYEDVNTDLENAGVAVAGASADRHSWLLNVAHSMGPIVLKAQYGQVKWDDLALKQSAWALGADYNLSKRTTAYVVYGRGDNDITSNESAWNIGVKHSF